MEAVLLFPLEWTYFVTSYSLGSSKESWGSPYPTAGKSTFYPPCYKTNLFKQRTKSKAKKRTGRSYSADHFSLSLESSPWPWFYQLWSLPQVLPVSSKDPIKGSLSVCADELYLPDETLRKTFFQEWQQSTSFCVTALLSYCSPYCAKDQPFNQQALQCEGTDQSKHSIPLKASFTKGKSLLLQLSISEPLLSLLDMLQEQTAFITSTSLVLLKDTFFLRRQISPGLISLA